MLDKALASVRIGAAEVDTIVEDDVLVPGEEFSGHVVVQGGNVDQEIEGLEHRLVASTPDEEGTTEVTLDRWQVSEPFTIHEDERKEIPFERVLHQQAPVTEFDATSVMDVWIDTGLAIDKAVDDSDTDYLRVGPTEAHSATVEAMDRLGLALYRVSADAGQVTVNGREAPVAYDQEFDFTATDRYDGPRFNEYQLHFVPRPHENETDLLLEAEPSSSMSASGDVFRGMAIDHDDPGPEHLAEEISDLLRDAAGR